MALTQDEFYKKLKIYQGLPKYFKWVMTNPDKKYRKVIYSYSGNGVTYVLRHYKLTFIQKSFFGGLIFIEISRCSKSFKFKWIEKEVVYKHPFNQSGNFDGGAFYTKRYVRMNGIHIELSLKR